MSRSLAAATWTEVERGMGGRVLAVPVGSTEQHGPHLPLSTDTDIAVALTERLAAAVEGVVVGPAVSYGASGEHAGFAGTLSIGCDALELLLVELCRSAAATFSGTVLVSAHGGNAEPVDSAVRLLTYEGRAVLAWSPHWSGDAHAGRTETALMLALAPEGVRTAAAAAGNDAPIAELWPRLRSDGVRSVAANGVLGDPAGASAQEGHALLSAAAEDLAAAVRRWRGGSAG
jgi:mycofactocin precursor peptide peptidase